MTRSWDARRSSHDLCPAMKPARGWGCGTALHTLPRERVPEGFIGAHHTGGIAQSATRMRGLAGVQVTASEAMHPCCPCMGTPRISPAQTLLLRGTKSNP